MKDLCAIPAEELTVLATFIANELAKDKSFDEIFALRNLLSQIVQTLSTLAAQRQICERCAYSEGKTF